MACMWHRPCPYPCVFHSVLVVEVGGPYEMLVRDLGFARKFLSSVSGLVVAGSGLVRHSYFEDVGAFVAEQLRIHARLC
jgi:hypothetical protein